MSDKGDESEIIFIRKRHGDDEEGHHGGVWKLAFADFMTAMMAFFLVMWLINSTSKETKAAIVQYFNPVQLIDSNPAHKGLRDPQEAGQGKSQKATTAEDKNMPASAAPPEKDEPQREAALLYDPMTTLDQIASKQAAASFGDPYDRSARGVGYVEERIAEDNGSPDKSTQAESAEEARAKPAPSTPSTPGGKNAQQQRQAALAPPAPADEKKADTPAAVAMRQTLDKLVKAETSTTHAAPHLEVTETSEGLLISLTDDANFSMFAVGSVEPKPQLVRIIGQIGRILAKQPGEIELRGHTDARSYKSKTYDNWRLSADRANMAYYMLARGGLPEKRVVKIAGLADRKLKSPKEPLAAVNRRIEILLRRSER
jgi:chemotaxis protein MotB